MMSSPGIKIKCKKCHCIISNESNDRLCDNCNMDLIAQNLAAEFYQHEIHRQDTETTDIECIAETSQSDTPAISETAEDREPIMNKVEPTAVVPDEKSGVANEQSDVPNVCPLQIEETDNVASDQQDNDNDSKNETIICNADASSTDLTSSEPSTSSFASTRSSESKIFVSSE